MRFSPLLPVLGVLLPFAAGAAALQPPVGAVQVSSDLFMRPVGLDSFGCPAYEPWSPIQNLPRTVHYQRGDGSFTTERAEAACNVNEAAKRP